MKRLIVVILAAIIYFSALNTSLASEIKIPQFQVQWRAGIIVGVVVSPNSTKDQLKALIFEFQKARREHFLTKYLPATTPGISGDSHAQVIIFVFSDPKWATKEKYNEYEISGMRSQKAQAYLNKIIASFEFNYMDSKEYGSLGYDEGGMKSASFKKFF